MWVLLSLPPCPTHPVDFVAVWTNSSSPFHASQIFQDFLPNKSGKQSSMELNWNLDHCSILNWLQNYTCMEKTQTNVITGLENWTGIKTEHLTNRSPFHSRYVWISPTPAKESLGPELRFELLQMENETDSVLWDCLSWLPAKAKTTFSKGLQ